MSTAINQETMQQLHIDIATLIAHREAGIMTDLEFVYSISNITNETNKMLADLKGLIDVNTGLRYK